MKKRILNLVIALTLISATTFAGNITSVTTVGAKSLVVDTKNWKSESVSIQIRDEEGVILFEDTFTSQQRKRLNLERLPEGVYSIVLYNEIKSTKQLFTLREKEAIELSEFQTTYRPIIKVNNQFVDLNYMAKGKNTTVSVYSFNDQVFTMTIENEKSISKRFDIKSLPVGTYTFNVASENESYSRTFRK